MERVAIIFGSSRNDGDTQKVIDHLNENETFTIFNLNDYKISYYDYQHRNINDDYISLMSEITENFDLLIFATPIYWYTMSAQIKTFLDRITDLLKVKKDIGRKLRGKKMGLISVSNDDDRLPSFAEPFSHSASYLGMSYIGDIHVVVENGMLTNTEQSKINDFKNIFS